MADKGKKKSKSLGKFLTQGEHVVAVDVGSRYVKIAVLHKRKDVIETTVLDAEPIPYLSARGDITPQQVSSALTTVLERNNIKNVSFISMLPLEFVNVKRFEVPSISKKQIKQIVPFEAEKHLPFSIDRAVIDFDFMPIEDTNSLPDENAGISDPTSEKAIEAKKAADAMESAGNKSIVTLAAVRSAIIPKFLELCNVKGCRQKAIDVTAFALYNSLSFSFQNNAPNPDDGDVVLIDIGARRTEMIVVSAKTGELLFTRSISFGGDVVTDAVSSKLNFPFEEAERIKCEKWENTGIIAGSEEYNEIFEPLISQLEKSLRYIKKSGLSAEQSVIWLSGGTSATPGFADYIESKFNSPVRIFNSLPFVNAEKTQKIPQIFSAVVGGALRMINEAKLTVDLLPVDITKLQQLAVRKRRFIQLGIIAAVIVGILLSIFGVKVLLTDLERRRLRAEYMRVNPKALASKVDSLEKRNETLRIAIEKMEGLTDRKTSWSGVLQTLANSMSSNIWVNKLSVDKKNYLTIDAYSIGNDYINFKNKLIASIRFDDVRILNEQIDRSGKFKIFKLRCKVIPDYKFNEEFDRMGKELLGKLRAISGNDESQENQVDVQPPLAAPKSVEKTEPVKTNEVITVKKIEQVNVAPSVPVKYDPLFTNAVANPFSFNKENFAKISNQLEKTKLMLKNSSDSIEKNINKLPDGLKKLILEKQGKPKSKTLKNNEAQ